MYLIRHAEEEIARRYHPADLMRCPTHLSIGQEAAAVGVMMALQPDDHVYGSHRCHGPYLAKGGDLDAMIAELHGKATGCTGGLGGSMHLVDEGAGFMGAAPVVGDAVSLAIGSALGFKMDGSGRVAVAFFGDSAVETGQFWEAANFAALHQLPVMLICENNLYATATPLTHRQPATPIHQRVKAFMWSTRIEDTEVAEVYGAAQACRDAAPGFLEIGTYRYREHVGVDYDWDIGYRTRGEVESYMANDPVAHARARIRAEEAAAIEEEVAKVVDRAFNRAIADPWPEGFLL